MQNNKYNVVARRGGFTPRLAKVSILCVLPLAYIGPVAALELSLGEEASLNLNGTLGYAVAYRVQDPDLNAPNRPNSLSDATFDKGVVSQVAKAGGELDLKWRNFGFYTSANAFYDRQIMDKGRGGAVGAGLSTLADADVWSDEAESLTGSDAEFLDAYAYASFEFENVAGIEYLPLDVRVGKQVINWGEGLFFTGGVSTSNPFNINNFVLPGSEIKEAFIGLEALYLQAGLSDNLSLSTYYQWDWEKARFPGVGTFYGDDLLGPGGAQEDFLGLGAAFGVPLRGPDMDAKKSGQWGISSRYIAGDTEYGIYYSRYHETMPHFRVNALGGLASFNQIYPENVDMFGVSFATTVGEVALAGELAYRPDLPVVSENPGVALNAAFDPAASGSRDLVDRRDAMHASVNALWSAGAGLGFDSHFLLGQVGADYLSGDKTGVPGNSWVTTEAVEADDLAWGVAVDWTGTWNNVLPGLDLSPGLFLQYDIDGYSHFWGNFSEERLQGQARLVGTYLNDLEVGLSYNWADSPNSNFDTQDTVNLSLNYKF